MVPLHLRISLNVPLNSPGGRQNDTSPKQGSPGPGMSAGVSVGGDIVVWMVAVGAWYAVPPDGDGKIGGSPLTKHTASPALGPD